MLDACAVYIFYGSSSMDSSIDVIDADVTVTGTECDGNFGYVVKVGDVSGDGIDDIIVSANRSRGVVRRERCS